MKTKPYVRYSKVTHKKHGPGRVVSASFSPFAVLVQFSNDPPGHGRVIQWKNLSACS